MFKYKSIFLSDIHLGCRSSQADMLCLFLKNNTCETLFLVGDIIDFWKLRRNVYWPQTHSNVIRRLLTASKRGTKINYIIGNHDDLFDSWFPDIHPHLIDNIRFARQIDYRTITNKKLLITHGDLFDGVIRHHRWLSLLGDRAYTSLLTFNSVINKIRRWSGFGYWSLSSFIKTSTKQAVTFITKFEFFLQKHAKENGYDGVICGHIHAPKIVIQDGFTYINTGDWCESISAVVEHHDGMFELLVWNSEQQSLTSKQTWIPQ